MVLPKLLLVYLNSSLPTIGFHFLSFPFEEPVMSKLVATALFFVLLVQLTKSDHFKVPAKDANSFVSDFKGDYGKPKTYQLIVIVAFALSLVLSLITAVLAWSLVAEVYLKCQQTIRSCKLKLEICDNHLSARAFKDDLIGRLSHVCKFDMNKNQSEVQDQLNSLYAPQ
ncbi:hypothetical protein M3Y96_00133100 [Aphelenchoides besseyi]|nr:hypothetical protein M3Y96_00133100 [Aphelenchoides besseyi]